jgi:outer membrane protein TolC
MFRFTAQSGRHSMKISSFTSRVLTVILIPASLLAEPVPLRRVVELALSHATGAAIAAADEQRANAGYRELRDGYIPQLTAGAGLGFSYGFPLGLAGSPPSLFNLNTQSALLNSSLRASVRAAQADAAVATLKNKDQRNQVIQDAVLSYTELTKWEQRLAQLQETQAQAERIQTAVAERVKEGVDSELDGTRAKLAAARTRQRVVEAQGAADVLREHLSKLTGLPAAGLQTESDSLPDFPAPPAGNPAPAPDSTASNVSVKAAVEHARAQYLRAESEHRALWPSVDFAAQYALLSKFNNFQQYYIPAKPCPVDGVSVLCDDNNFHQNNATVGISIRIPLFNAAQRERAHAADADAVKASKQAEAARNQVSEETLRLQRSVTQLAAARDVAALELEIARKNAAAIHTRMDAGTANLHDLDDAATQSSERFIALQDVAFELERAQLALLRSTGDLEKWALGAH